MSNVVVLNQGLEQHPVVQLADGLVNVAVSLMAVTEQTASLPLDEERKVAMLKALYEAACLVQTASSTLEAGFSRATNN